MQSLQFRTGDNWINIFRPEPKVGAFVDGLPLFGCFPMVPFANRISRPFLPLGDAEAEFPVNWPCENVAMHGVGFSQSWIVQHSQPDQARLSVEIYDISRRRLGIAHQDMSLSDKRGFSNTLSYTHEHDKPMLAGVGLHPWFFAPPTDQQIELNFDASGVFEMGVDQFPKNHIIFSKATPQSIGIGQNGLDTCFTSWNGCAVLRRPSAEIDIQITSDAAHLHCFVSPDHESICAEPVTHAPNAAQDKRWKSVGQMRKLNAGQTTSVSLSLSVAIYGKENL